MAATARTGGCPSDPTAGSAKSRREPSEDTNNGKDASDKKKRGRKFPRLWAAAIAAALAVGIVVLPHTALADEDWRDEIDFELFDPVPGRRLFVEGLTVTGDKAAVALRAATDLHISVQAYGGRFGTELVSWATAHLREGEGVAYELPLEGPYPSFTFSWEDSLGQAGAFSLANDQIPHPLPMAEGEICDLGVVSLGWTSGRQLREWWSRSARTG